MRVYSLFLLAFPLVSLGFCSLFPRCLQVRASYLEIYNEEIRDLLSKDHKKQLQLKESVDQGVYVKDLSMFVLKSVTEIEHVFNVGSKNRSVGSTQMNQDSSRSHSICTYTRRNLQLLVVGRSFLRDCLWVCACF